MIRPRVRDALVATILATAATSIAAPPDYRVAVDARIVEADRLADAIRGAPPAAGAPRLVSVGVADPLADATRLATIATTRPAAGAPLVAVVAPGEPAGRPRVTVCDPHANLRLATEALDSRADATQILAATARAAAKAAERPNVVVAALPSRPAGGHALAAADVDLAVAAALLARPGVVLAETQFARRLSPTPAVDAPPIDSPAPYVLTTELANAGGRSTARLTLTSPAGGKPQSLVATAPTEAALPEAVAKIVRTVPLPPPGRPSTRPVDAVFADLARTLYGQGRFDESAAVAELAIDRAPADLALRRDVMVAYLRANGILPPPPPGKTRVNVVDVTDGVPEISYDARLDAIAARTFFALGHLEATSVVPRTHPPAGATPPARPTPEMTLLRSMFEPPNDPRRPPAIGPLSDVAPRMARHVATWRAIFTRFADERLRAATDLQRDPEDQTRPGPDDDTLCLRTATSHLEPAEQMAGVFDFVAARRDVPHVRDRLAAYADTFSVPDETRYPLRRAFYERVAPLGPSFAEAVRRARASDEQAAEASRARAASQPAPRRVVKPLR